MELSLCTKTLTKAEETVRLMITARAKFEEGKSIVVVGEATSTRRSTSPPVPIERASDARLKEQCYMPANPVENALDRSLPLAVGTVE